MNDNLSVKVEMVRPTFDQDCCELYKICRKYDRYLDIALSTYKCNNLHDQI